MIQLYTAILFAVVWSAMLGILYRHGKWVQYEWQLKLYGLITEIPNPKIWATIRFAVLVFSFSFLVFLWAAHLQ